MSGGFELRKWASNHPQILANIDESHCQSSPICFDDESKSVVKILGLQWNPQLDYFNYRVQPMDRLCTKRTLLSELARIYDPLGYLAPITAFAKFMIQHLWALGLKWDETPPPDVVSRWHQFKLELPLLSDLRIPRYIWSEFFDVCEIHGYCDASELGYAAVIYVRFLGPDNSVKVHFVCAKSKIAPLKRLSIPRLELCAALLLSRLLDSVLKIHGEFLTLDKVYAWSDSTVALAWIQSSPHRWKTFVSNRVSQIQYMIPSVSWHHVSTAKNPADCASRGLLPRDLLPHSLWWTGLPELQNPEFRVGTMAVESDVDSEALSEERRLVLLVEMDSCVVNELLIRFSLLRKIQCILAYCLRFISSCKHNNRTDASLSSVELYKALTILIQRTQAREFSNEIISIESTHLPKYLKRLAPFLDEDSILRVGGRLRHASISFDSKHPILLPSKCRLTELIVEDFHQRYFHPGTQTLHFLLRQQFWILSGKRTISRLVSKCMTYWRLKPTSLQPPMGDLPAARLSQVKPFSSVGVDYGGPFNITLGRTRGAKTYKAYICLFVCFTTKALHLELASDLSTDAFLAALRRFVARRGRCATIFSDCGTNFVGANKYLTKCMQDATELEQIEWRFNPPSAPHFGGLWEAGIKSVKTHLARVVGDQLLTYEEFNTVLAQIEALLNSRPLSPMSSDPNDLSVLTPGHFLTLEPISSLPDFDLSGLKLNTLSRWQLLQRIHSDFWTRWQREYLQTLQQRSKWINPSIPIKLDTLVVIKSDVTPPSKWRLGRVTEVHPGSDGVVRVVSVRTSRGVIKRPVVKLCPLPLCAPVMENA